jgi:hypothetical protein
LHGLQGLQALAAAQGLQGLQAAAAQGLQTLQAAICTEVSAAFALAVGKATTELARVATLRATKDSFNMAGCGSFEVASR